MRSISSQNWAARQRVHPRCRLIEYQQVRIVDQRAAQRELLLHAAGQLAGRPIRKRIEAGRSEQFVDAPFALGFGLVEEAAEKVEVLEYGQGRVEVAPKALRHVGNAGQARTAMLTVAHVAIQCYNFAFLDPAHARNQCEQRRFADTVRTDQPDHATGRDFERHIVERDGQAAAVRHASHPRSGTCHYGSFTARLPGQPTSRPERTNPTPRIPVFTWVS